MEIILLLTACIKPNVSDNIAISDYTKRENMYIDALNWYINNTNFRIIFVENSGTNIKENINADSDRIEFLTFESKVNPQYQNGAVVTKKWKYLNMHLSIQNFLRKKI